MKLRPLRQKTDFSQLEELQGDSLCLQDFIVKGLCLSQSFIVKVPDVFAVHGKMCKN